MKRLMKNIAKLVLVAALTGPAFAAPSVVVDATTGDVLAANQAFDRWYPASLTKLMTAYIAFDALKSGRLKADSPVTISANAAKQPPSKMGYKPGNVLTLDNALKIMLVKSANDIAVAVGEAVGGQNYPDLMNETAAKLGMAGSHFTIANGLHDPQNYSTARDLAVLASALRTDFPQFASYFDIEAISYSKHVERNYNLLLGRFNGADGMKTGFVCASGFNLVASATRDGRTLIAVVLGAMSQEQRAEKAANLLEAGFRGQVSPLAKLALMKPDAEVSTVAPDLHDSVCTAKAAADRWDGRDIEGNIKFETPYIQEMTRAPVTLPVGLLSAGPGAGNLTLDNLARIPVPQLRPERANAVKDNAGSQAVGDAALRPAIAAKP